MDIAFIPIVRLKKMPFCGQILEELRKYTNSFIKNHRCIKAVNGNKMTFSRAFFHSALITLSTANA